MRPLWAREATLSELTIAGEHFWLEYLLPFKIMLSAPPLWSQIQSLEVLHPEALIVEEPHSER